jgi:hypothetical protein
MSAIGASWILGFLLQIVLAACINPNLQAVLSSPFGQPMAQIYFDAIGKHGAMGMMALLFICQFQMGLSTVSNPQMFNSLLIHLFLISSLLYQDNLGHSLAMAPCHSAPFSAQFQLSSLSHPFALSGAAPSSAQFSVSSA